MLVLPVLIAVFLGIATVARLFLGNMAVSQAAELGVQAWSQGGSAASVDGVVNATLVQEGYHAQAATQLISTGTLRRVSVSVPVNLWNTGQVATVSASRTMVSAPAAGSTGGGGVSNGGSGGSGNGNGGGYIYRHFPMW